jgi:Conjugal transfer protein TraD
VDRRRRGKGRRRADTGKARTGQEEAKLRSMQRKERRRIEIGGLAVKAGIDGLSAVTLYDRFLRTANEAADPKAVALWEWSRGRHFHQENDTPVVAVAKFAGKIAPDRPVPGGWVPLEPAADPLRSDDANAFVLRRGQGRQDRYIVKE